MKLESPISPKVIAAAIVGIVLTAIVSNLYAITPDMLNFLGPWKVFVGGVLLTALTSLAAWWKTDPLRTGYVPEPTTPAPTAAEPAAPTTFTATQAIPAPVEVAPILPN